jgi:eukaryotic-like serine/threonine-protein kinase
MERSLSLTGSIINARYRLNAVSSVTPDVAIYAAEELRFGRRLAVKVLRDDVARDAEFVAAVRQQASALTLSAHADRGVPRLYECGATNTGEPFIAIEWTEGTTLRAILAQGALRPSAALRIASKVGEALETLHHNGIVHGELGPESVLLVKDKTGEEQVRLVDVELTAAHRTPLGRRRRGTPPAYLVPEEMQRGETTQASDQYALGMLLRELLTAGRDTSVRSFSPEIEAIIRTALDPKPESRFPDISVMVNDMWAAQTALAEAAPRRRSDGVRRRQRSRVPEVPVGLAATVAAAGVVVVVGWLAFSLPSVLLALTSLPRPAVTTVPLPAATLTPVVEEPTLPAPNVTMPEPPRVAPPQTAGMSPAVVAPPAPVSPPAAVSPPAPVSAPAAPVEPPARSTAPVIDRAPRHHESVTAAQPPATIEPPMKAAPPVKVEPPVKAAPPVKIEFPVKAAPPVKVEPPGKAAPPVKIEFPVKAAPPVKAEPSVVKAEPPVKAVAPVRVEPPAKSERPAKATPPAQKEDPAADGKDGTAIIDWLLKPRR